MMKPLQQALMMQHSRQEFLTSLWRLPAATRRIRMKTRCETDTLLFARWFFPHHCRLDESDFQRELLALHVAPPCEPPPHRTGYRRAVAAPRGSAKSTLASLILLMHDILHARERYVIILSATLKQAAQRLRNLRAELAGNARLRQVYAPQLRRRGPARAHSLALNGVQIDVFGSGAEIRGLTSGPWRPTKIILDDVEDSEGVETPGRREKLADWYNEVVENLGDTYTHILIVGTILHPESLLATLLKRPDFEAHRYRAIETFSPRQDLWAEWRRRFVDLANPRRIDAARRFFRAHKDDMLRDTRVLWPAREDYYQLMVQLVTRGRRAFYQEKQNEPLCAGAAIFQPETIRRFRREGANLVLLPKTPGANDPAAEGTTTAPLSNSSAPTDTSASASAPAPASVSIPIESLRIVGFLDPALGRGHGDDAALAIVGASPGGMFLLLELLARRATPLEQIRWIFDAHERWRFHRLGIEGNCFQELLAIPFEQERARRRAEGKPADVALDMITHRRNKIERIAALEPFLVNGWLALADDVPEVLWRQLQSFPGCDHDDALDALEGAVDLARRRDETGPRLSQRRPPTPAPSAARQPRSLREF